MAAVPLMLRAFEREARVYRAIWRSTVVSVFIIPVLFLVAIGQGLGGLIDQRTGDVDGLPYLQFVMPGLLAGMTMQGAVPNSLWPVMAGTKWVRFFHGVVATPMSAADLYGGFVLWGTLRSAVAATTVVAAGAVMGAVPSAWGVLGVPAAALCALAFIAPLTAFAATQSNDISFGVILRLVIVPLFLFSGTFFPVTELPGWLQGAVRFSPLWHAIELCRSATTGSAQLGPTLVHIAVLAGIAAAGWLWGTRTFAAKLTK